MIENQSTNHDPSDREQYGYNTKQLLLPILFAVILAAGIFIGNYLALMGKTPTVLLQPESNKLSAILQVIEDNYVDSLSRSELIEKSIPDILKELDPHSVYIPAQDVAEVNAPLEGNFDGIGVQFNIQEDTIFVVNTIPNGPSEKVGVLAGDRIVTINDSVFAGKGISDRDVIKNLKGPSGTEVKIGVARRGTPGLIDFVITRGRIPIYSVDVAYMPSASTGYIKISQFARTTHEEFVAAAEKLLMEGMENMILDLRGNSGGFMDAAIGIADEFLEEGKLIVYTEGHARPKANYRSTDQGVCKDIKLFVLIDSWSASASEIVSGAIQDNDRGVIIGRRSFGKGLVQEPTYFRDGSQMRLTVARYYTPTGRCIQKPYTKGTDAYYHELVDRYNSGEMDSAMHKQIPDSLKYTTPKGKIVYGGGGITPDVFVPVDTIGNSPYLLQAIRLGLIYRFALRYTDENRKDLSGFKDPLLLEDYLENQGLVQKFVAFANDNGLKPKATEIQLSRKIIETQLYAYIARNVLDEAGFYPILHQIDETFIKALKLADQSDKLTADNNFAE